MKTNMSVILAAFAVTGSLACGNALAGDDRIRLTCGSEGAGDTSMDARYEQRRGRAKFDASFEAAPWSGFTEGDVLAVLVGGIDVGSMVLVKQLNGDLGGDLEFDTRRDEFNPFPEDFPEVTPGTSVTVGPLGCALDD